MRKKSKSLEHKKLLSPLTLKPHTHTNFFAPRTTQDEAT